MLAYEDERLIEDALWEEHYAALMGTNMEDGKIVSLDCAFPPDAPDGDAEFFTLEGEALDSLLHELF